MLRRFSEKPGVIVASAIGLFIGLNVIFSFTTGNIRADFTQDRLHSVSDTAKSLALKTPETVKLKVYFSPLAANNFPALQDRYKRVRLYLKALQSETGGKVSAEFVNIEPFSETEDEAVARGLKGITLPDGQTLYFGVTGENLIDGAGVIPFFTPDRDPYLEYDIASLIDGLSGRKRPKIGLLSSLPLSVGKGGLQAALKGETKPYALYTELNNAYDVKLYDDALSELDDKKSEQPNTLLIIHPRPFTEQAIERLKKFLANGGRLALALDPFNEAISQTESTGRVANLSSDPEALLSVLGVKFAEDKIILDPQYAKRGVDPNTGKPAEFLAWLQIPFHQKNTEPDPLTARLKFISLGTVSFFEKDKLPAGLTYTPLLQSSAESRFIKREDLLSGASLTSMNTKKEEIKARDVIVKITGNFKNPSDSSYDQTQTGAVILIGDGDFFDDRYWIANGGAGTPYSGTPFADNGNFILNLADYLTGSSELIALRGQKLSERSFTYLTEIRENAEKKFKTEEEKIRSEITVVKKRLDDLRSRTDVLSSTEIAGKTKAEIDQITLKLLENRRKLREVQRDLNQDIRLTGAIIKIVNIGLIPVLIGLAPALWLFWRKIRNRKSAVTL